MCHECVNTPCVALKTPEDAFLPDCFLNLRIASIEFTISLDIALPRFKNGGTGVIQVLSKS